MSSIADGGGAGLATGMAAGLVGGMVLDEALRGPGYGYGGGAPMGYGGYPDESRNLGILPALSKGSGVFL